MELTLRKALGASMMFALLAAGCNGGGEGRAAEESLPKKNPIPGTQAQKAPTVDAEKQLRDISKAIPVYAGAQYRDDLTRRDEVMIRSQYGPEAKVYTMATDDSFPQVYHYYTTYLAQFRAYAPPSPFPPPQQNWRTLEIPLNQAMQDPFIPGDTIRTDGSQVLLQVAETEAEPHTVIRYIVTPQASPQPVQTAAK